MGWVRACARRIAREGLASPGSILICFDWAAIRRWRSYRPLLLTLLLTLSLYDCSAAPVIDLFSADYRKSEALAGDAQLLLNILRAKDDLPIHFADLAIIHGSIQLTASNTTTLPFAHFAGSNVPSSVAPAVSAGSSPTFDVGTLDTQDFTRGMLSPVDPKIIKQLFDQGVDPRLIMLLFFSQFENPDHQLFFNNMACDIVTPGTKPQFGCLNRVYGYLDEIDNLLARKIGPTHPAEAESARLGNARKQLQANVYVALQPIGSPLTGSWTLATNLTDLRQLDPAKYKIIGKQVYAISEPRLAICYEEGRHHDFRLGHHLIPLFPLPGSEAACTKSEVVVSPGPKANVGFSIRSSYEILQFLGQVLRFQQEQLDRDRCLTLDKENRSCGTGEVLFQVNAPVGRPVVGTAYDGNWYALYDRSCNMDFQESCDYSLQVLGILELLLNANKSAKDIPSTPRVQVVP